MIQETYLKEILEPVIRDNQLLLVDVHITPQNRITIVIDSIKGVTIDDCVLVNRYVEERLDRESEDFHLEVSSPGADQPLKIREQYLKHRGRKMQIELLTGKQLTGTLREVSEEGIILEQEIPDGKKKNSEGKGSGIVSLGWEEIKQGKVIISFK
ncbi:MAG: ribosome assembly cofactor RimP [Bacteroidales bacterium]|nr:ribosome assembly cofactor RimP [Bacteroidales bacterium]